MAMSVGGCFCRPSCTSLATDAISSYQCTHCGRLRCGKCKGLRCCSDSNLVSAKALLFETLGVSLLACPRGCVGGSRHSGSDCPRQIAPGSIAVGNARLLFRPGKRIKIVESLMTEAIVLELKATEYGVERRDTVLIGPSLPGFCVHSLCTSNKTKARVLETIRVHTRGRRWVPESSFLNFSCAEWETIASSTCAWERVIERKQLQKSVQRQFLPHKRLKRKEEGSRLAQPPPAIIPSKRGGKFFRCAYCSTLYTSFDKFRLGCAPDVTTD